MPESIQDLKNRIVSEAKAKEHVRVKEHKHYPKLLSQDCSLLNARKTALQASSLGIFSYHCLT